MDTSEKDLRNVAVRRKHMHFVYKMSAKISKVFIIVYMRPADKNICTAAERKEGKVLEVMSQQREKPQTIFF